MGQTWGWAGSAVDFLRAPNDDIMLQLEEHQLRCMGDPPSGSQCSAWREEIAVLRTALTALQAQYDLDRWSLVLEYELPREGGRRPDVVVLAGDQILVLEFKSDPVPSHAYLDQVDAYARDLSEYHSGSHERRVVPVLVLVRGDADQAKHYGVMVTNGVSLGQVLAQQVVPESSAAIDLHEWLESEYAPLPSLVRAARTIFEHEPLPRVRRAESSGVEEAVSYLQRVAEEASRDGGMHLALVAGVPGAGKTLVGLRFVYETHFGELGGQNAVFLSGNGPLVQVLQYTLSGDGREGKVFVQDVHKFLKTYGGSSQKSPREHVWVYDEAQRAWDVERVRTKRPDGHSEPEDFLRIGEKLGDWALMVGLIGEGQEIYVGEESGMPQWNEALASVPSDWTVHCPSRLSGLLGNAADVRPVETLDLDVTLRSHKAEELHEWVSLLLDGRLDQARSLSASLKRNAFAPLVTRDAEAARLYARGRYLDAPEARYGMLVSSQRKWASPDGWFDDFYLKPGPWFVDGDESPQSCRRLEKAVTEFQCQGLELDLPVIGWGGDLLWQDGWHVPPGVRKSLKHPDQITKNVYRVLLTRSRDGFVVFVPRREELDGVFESLLQAGCDQVEVVDLR